MLEFKNTKSNIDENSLTVLELVLDINLPADYKAHILKNNGGECNHSQFNFFESGLKTSSEINYFYAFYTGKYSNIYKAVNIFKVCEKRMPSKIVPIAYDSGGNQICISCNSSDFGVVYFWDHEKEVDYSISEDSDFSNLYFIASGFTEFLESLY